MARPTKYDNNTVDIKLTIPKDLRDLCREEKLNVSEFLTYALYEHFNKNSENSKKALK